MAALVIKVAITKYIIFYQYSFNMSMIVEDDAY